MKLKLWMVGLCALSILTVPAQAAAVFVRYSLDSGNLLSTGVSTLGAGGSFGGQNIEDLVGTSSYLGVSFHNSSWIDLMNGSGQLEMYNLDTGAFFLTGVATLSGGSFDGVAVSSLVGTSSYLGTSNSNAPFINLLNGSGIFERFSIETGAFQSSGVSTLSGGSFDGQTIASLAGGSNFLGVSNNVGSWLDLVNPAGAFERYSLDTGNFAVTGASLLSGGVHGGEAIEDFVGSASLLGTANHGEAFLMTLSSPVPEPGRGVLAVLGLMGALFLRRR